MWVPKVGVNCLESNRLKQKGFGFEAEFEV